jgi:exodeoxyribonuclease VII large subunit
VARSIAASSIPVISAVGHEIDVTISDMVADLRAATPTAAAEWITAQLEELQRTLLKNRNGMVQALQYKTDRARQTFQFLVKRLSDPRRRLDDLRLALDDRLDRLQLAMGRYLERRHLTQRYLSQRLFLTHPGKMVALCRSQLNQLARRLAASQQRTVEQGRFLLQESTAKLESLSPLAVLARGYSITQRLTDLSIVRDFSDVQAGNRVLVRLARGFLECRVTDATDTLPSAVRSNRE